MTTIVSGKMSKEIGKRYGVERIETLTGFKYIGEQMKLFEQSQSHEFLFGYEESYGCLLGTHARDKDAVVAVMALCEAAAYYRSQGLTLCQQMEKLFQQYGYFRESLCTATRKGVEGAEEIRRLMARFRESPPRKIGDSRVGRFWDYKKGVVLDYGTGEEHPISLPKSDVLYFDLEDGAWCCVRPSGTEPKVKFYMGVRGRCREDAEEKLDKLTKAVMALAQV